MNKKPPLYTAEESGAFAAQFTLEPTAQGPLTGKTFVAKDVIDIAGMVTGRGSPAWAASHGPAPVSAPVVELLLDAGAVCVGKAQTDEMAFGMDGENHFFGTPINPAAPDRVPGGSSSGSASAVACGLADFALATDTGGSIRMPASNCGLLGYRPSHDLVLSAGVAGLVPSFDTTGLIAGDAALLEAAAAVLTCLPAHTSVKPGTLNIVTDGFDQCQPETREALLAAAAKLAPHFTGGVRQVSLEAMAGEGVGWAKARGIYMNVQRAELWSHMGAWVENAGAGFGPRIQWNFDLARKAGRTGFGPWLALREQASRALNASLGENDVLCVPSVPCPAPLKGSLGVGKNADDYFRASLALTAVAGIGRMPQVSLPLAAAEGAPVGLSLVARRDQDMFLLALARMVMEGV